MYLGLEGNSLFVSFRLRYYESREAKKVEKPSTRIKNYTLEVLQLNKLSEGDPLKVKEELWCHLESILHKEYPNEKIFDIQIATNNTEYLKLLETLNKANTKLQLTAKRLVNHPKKFNELDKQAEKIKDIEKQINEYKEKHKESQAIKAFVTFSSIKAANYIKKLNNICCCRTCKSKHITIK